MVAKMLSPSEARQHYEDKGYVHFKDVLDPGLIAEADAHVDWLLARNPELRPEDLGHRLARHDPFWLRLVADDRLLDIAQIFIGPDIALFATHYLCKPPRTGRPVLWHQDGTFWPLDPMEVITLWVAITDSDPENGCLRVIPQTHTQALQGMTERQDVDSVLRSETDYNVDETQPSISSCGPATSPCITRTSCTARTRTHPTAGAAPLRSVSFRRRPGSPNPMPPPPSCSEATRSKA